MIGGDDPLYLKFWVKPTTLNKIADFQSIFARSALVVARNTLHLAKKN